MVSENSGDLKPRRKAPGLRPGDPANAVGGLLQHVFPYPIPARP